ncbi:MAG: hypothetical protein NTW28_09050 [Candidatus Solibacter sp.]|nr:hypothetical protein [Candidatus Solibacter sp.]
MFTNTTGGRTLRFLKKNTLERAIQLHAIRVAVKNRPELPVKTREGYWALQ